MTPGQFRELYDEVVFQERVSDYETALYVANILAAITNTIPRKGGRGYTAKDFMEIKPPKRGGESLSKEEIKTMADSFDIKLPSK